MRWGVGSSSKTNFEWVNIADEDNQSSFKDQRIVSLHVSNKLLGQRKSSCLAAQKVNPLRANSRDKECALSVFLCLGSVANLNFRDIRDSPVFRNILISWVPSALGPFHLPSELIEKSDVHV